MKSVATPGRDGIRRAGLPPMRFHDLRHAYATLLIECGTSPRVVMELMGHSTIAITMNLYSHVSDATGRAAVGLLAGVMRDATVMQSPPPDDPGGAGESPTT